MAIWVCRTGSTGEYEKDIYCNSRIYLTRAGYSFDFKKTCKEDILNKTHSINSGASRQTISNIWSQIDIFVNRMNIGDIVIIPKKGRYEISVARVIGDYEYNDESADYLKHTRKIELIAQEIDTSKFPRDIFYSLGAFRAIFSIRQEERMLNILKAKGAKI